jgi:signal peptidase I
MHKYIVVTDSMMPLIQAGAELFIEKIEDAQKLKKFDIILFSVNGKLTCHYFWHKNSHYDEGLIITRNLKNGSYDDSFGFDKIIGQVTNYKISFILKLKIFLRDKIV